MTNNIEVTFPIDSIVVWDNGETNVLGTVLSTGAGCYSVLLRDRTIHFVSTTALREPTPPMKLVPTTLFVCLTMCTLEPFV